MSGPPPLPPANVVLVDVRAERLAVMRALLDGSALVTVVGEADTESGAIAEVGRTGAGIVIVEIQMPVDEGLATVAALRQHFPLVRIIVCSFHHATATQHQARENGADAYLAKPVDVFALATLLRGFAVTGRDWAGDEEAVVAEPLPAAETGAAGGPETAGGPKAAEAPASAGPRAP